LNSPISSFSRNAKLFLTYALLINIVVGATNVLFGLYILKIGFSEEFYGRVVAAKTIAIGLAAIPGGFCCGRFGPAKSLMLASAIILVANILQFTFINEQLIIAGSLLSGMGYALVFVNESPFIMRNSCAENRVHLFSYNFTVTMLAYVLGNFLSGLFSDMLSSRLPEFLSMRISLLVFTFISFLSIIPVFLMNKRNAVMASSAMYPDIKQLQSSGTAAILGFTTLIGLGAGLVIPFFNIFLSYKLNLESYKVGTLMSASQFSIIIGTLIIPWAVSRLGKVNTVIICQMMSIPFLILIATPPNIYLVVFAFLMRSSLMCMAYPLTQNIAMEQVDDSARPLLSSLMKVFDNLSRGVGSFAGGYLMKNISYEFPYFITTVLYFSATLVFLFYFKTGKKYVENIM